MSRLWRGLAALLVGALALTARADGGGELWTLDAYLRAHPGQQAVAARFAARVDGEAAAPVQAVAPLRIAVIYPGMQVSDYWRRSVSVLGARLNELGVPYALDTHFSGPDAADVDVQLAQLRRALGGDPDYLIYTVASPTQRALVERVLMRGRPRVILQNLTTPLRAWAGMQPLLYVGFDHAEGSRMLAAHLRAQGVSGDYVVLMPDRELLGKMRGETFIAAVDGEALHLRGVYLTGLNMARARAAAADALQRHPGLRLIYAAATDIALGAAEAAATHGEGRPLINGWGGGSSELQALREGRIDFTVMRINDDNGVAMAEAIALDAQGRAAEVPTVYAGRLAVVARDSAEDVVDALVARAFRYSGVPEALR